MLNVYGIQYTNYMNDLRIEYVLVQMFFETYYLGNFMSFLSKLSNLKCEERGKWPKIISLFLKSGGNFFQCYKILQQEY